MNIPNRHPELQPITGYLFGNISASELDVLVGTPCRFKNPRCLAERGIHVVQMVQRNYARELCLRVVPVGNPEGFGCVMMPDQYEVVG